MVGYRKTETRNRRGTSKSTTATWPDPFPGTEEPTIADLMSDDVLLSVMASDGVAAHSLEALISSTRGRLEG
ncbi:MAG: hypothetical protein K9H25_05300 [Rhodospirillum sp.]|nr:hypothetical protein [Rhodospirillum sp.]MCF8488905.1 hypothetical protein [Rhodospirillum sp.]MCF8500033.1 hypothetical protein [Rhodospirillum sp.]